MSQALFQYNKRPRFPQFNCWTVVQGLKILEIIAKLIEFSRKRCIKLLYSLQGRCARFQKLVDLRIMARKFEEFRSAAQYLRGFAENPFPV